MAKWTREQEEAIYSRNTNLLVAAAAGSGKTAVLVERIICYICDEANPVDIDKLLIVTFTNAAAAEMKERIGSALSSALKNNPLSRHLSRQNILLNVAPIMTLHSFCLDIVRQNFFRIGIEPNFRIADETEVELLKLDVLDALLEKHYTESQAGDEFLQLVDAYGGQKEDKQLQDLILDIFSFSRSHPWPDIWLEKVVEKFTDTNWGDYIFPSVRQELKNAKSLLREAAKISELSGGPKAYLNNLYEEIPMLEDLLGALSSSWDNAYTSFNDVNFGKLSRVKKGEAEPELQERVKNLRDKAKGIIKDLQEKYFQRTVEEYSLDLFKVKPLLMLLCSLVKEFAEGFANEKRKRNIVDFNDLEHYCLQILMHENSTPQKVIPSEISWKLRERFQEILIDEYQDINDVQETILKLLSNDKNLFMVGDVKQSIYRFRLANPQLFLEKYKAYAEEKEKSKKIDLARNFRCRAEIVGCVNYLFQNIMIGGSTEINYDRDAYLVYGADYPEEKRERIVEGPVELHLLENPQGFEKEDDLTPLEREGMLIGQKICQLLNNEALIFDKGLKKYRLLNYKDIVVLLRSPRGNANAVMEKLKQEGIPAFADLGSGYFEATEVQVMLSLLKVIDNPRQDIPLAGVLRSPIYKLNVDELAEIRLVYPEGSFYEAVVKASEMEEDELGLRLRAFLGQLQRWRTLARQDSLANLIWTLYRETGYYDYVGATHGGSQRQANLRALQDRSRQYEKTSFRGLFMFLRFIERIRENKGDMEAAKALGENEDVVRIMSIHKSKGLEFPVVFVAGLGKEFNMMDTRKDIILHKDLGLGPVLIDSEKRIKYPTIAKLAVERKIKQESLAEEMRILYVALTRAREKLILLGSVGNIAKKVETWSLLQPTGARTYLDWLVPILLKHNAGEKLRNISQAISFASDATDSSCWDINIYQDEFISPEKKVTENNAKILKDIKELKPFSDPTPFSQKIISLLNWKYPLQDLSRKGAKLSVSEIKNLWRQRDELDFYKYWKIGRRPEFLIKEKGLSAAERGSVLHLVMQHVNLEAEINYSNIERLIEDLVARDYLTKEQSSTVEISKIINFYSSSLGKRMLQAQKVKREIPFSLALPAQNIYDDLSNCSEKVLVQGVIDCLWFEKDGWILLDYKSDNINKEEIELIKNRYEGQIALYAKAVETIFNQPVKEKYLYLFALEKTLQIENNVI